jgi:putative superfamily III holin-X
MATIEGYDTTASAREGIDGTPSAPDASGVSGAGQARLGALVATAGHDMSNLVRGEIELAKAEVRTDIRRAASGGAIFAVAALCGLSWLIVAGAYLVIAAIAALVGKVMIGRVGATKTSVHEAKESVAMLKQLRPNGGGTDVT